MTDKVTLYECKEATRDQGLVGEEDTVLTICIAFIDGGFIIMDGPSRSGKDAIVDGAEFLYEELPGDDPDWEILAKEGHTMYHWPSSTSPKAPFYNAPVLNQFPVHRFPDIVNLDEHLEGIMKAFGEGQAATHDKVDVALSDQDGTQDQIVDMKIQCPRTTIVFIATDNQKVDLNDLAEIRNRAFIVNTDASEELTRRINERQAQIRSGRYERKVSEDRLRDIRNHMNSIPVNTFTGGGLGTIVNPTAEALQKQEPIPPKFVEARQDFERLMDFIEAVTLFHYDRRMMLKNGKPKIFTAPADVWYGMKIFGEELVMSALNLRELDQVILRELRENPNTQYDIVDLQTVLRSEGLNMSDTLIRRSLDNMEEKTYVSRDDSGSGRVEYRISTFGTSINLDSSSVLDWEQFVDDTIETAEDVLDNDVADQYVSEYCKGSGLIVTHPLTGETVNILEDNEFEEKIEDGKGEIDDVMDTPLYGNNDDETEDVGTAVPQQGTL